MHTLFRLLSLVALSAASLPAADNSMGQVLIDRPLQERMIASLRTADDERIAATVAGDRARLEAVYSDELRYAHSNGRVDTKASQIEALVAGGNRYEGFEYKERTFTPAGSGVVLMTGRVLMHVASKSTGQKSTLDLSFLAVWREENRRWRFLAWQSCRNPPTDGKKK